MHVSTHPAGTCCWVELGTTDQAAAKPFYGELFGWTMDDSPIGPGETYTILKRNGLDVGGLYTLRAEDRARGVPTHWLVYFAVDDVDAATPRVAALGGRVVDGPLDAGSNGRMTVAADTEGAKFALWQAKEHSGAKIAQEDGALSWTELATHDADRARAFYGSIFGWRFEERTAPETPYGFAWLGDHMVAGLFPLEGAPMQHVPAHWMIYFRVAQCDGRAEWVAAHGGRIVVAPTDVPGWGRFSVLQDPQGGMFSVVERRRA
jgi:predicted enzyme related to lactoylglutathione lyase